MNRVCSIFSQILKLVPRQEFEVAVKDHKAELHAPGFSSWAQMIAMMYRPLTGSRLKPMRYLILVVARFQKSRFRRGMMPKALSRTGGATPSAFAGFSVKDRRA